MKHINHPVAVISGDIVASTHLTAEQYDRLLQQIKAIQAWISDRQPANAHSIERGDEFQTLVHDIENALRYAILYRVGIKLLGKPFDCRISFAIAADADLRETVSESMGEAFVLSGRALSALKGEHMMFCSDCPTLTERFDLLIKYLDWQLTDLTARQCEVLLPMLQFNEPPSISDLATQLNIATATASKSLKASGWQLIRELTTCFATHVKDYKHA